MICVASLARELMNKHGLGHWSFQFDRAKRRAGCCKRSRMQLTLSSYYISHHNDEADIKDTILHEIAHALAGPHHGHDEHWKSICRNIGARPIRCYDGERIVMPKGRWHAKCKSCGKEWNYHRKPKYDGRMWCKKCGSINGLLSFTLNCTVDNHETTNLSRT